MRRDRAASIRQRLFNGRPASEDFNTTLTRYAGARLLYRLSVSPHAERFVLKGAVLFSLWSVAPHRATRAASQFAKRLTAAVVALDNGLRAGSESTPEPAWCGIADFALEPESGLRGQLLEAERQVERAQRKKEELAAQIQVAGAPRALLFEKGKRLESAIVDSLKMPGFSAEPYRNSGSEFDVVFESAEGRLIGEAEGKDNKAVNIDKLRQLSMNIHEDLQRDAVTAPAKPVLFGNPFRLRPLSERGDPFTEKCLTTAASTATALVFTPDLFRVVQYLATQQDATFAAACRRALVGSVGRVSFPTVQPRSGWATPSEPREGK